jgi:hypothetical protein
MYGVKEQGYIKTSKNPWMLKKKVLQDFQTTSDNRRKCNFYANLKLEVR